MISNYFNDDRLYICIGNNITDQVDYVKFFGVHCDSKLNWKRLIHSLRCKLSKIISVFKNKLNAPALLLYLNLYSCLRYLIVFKYGVKRIY